MAQHDDKVRVNRERRVNVARILGSVGEGGGGNLLVLWLPMTFAGWGGSASPSLRPLETSYVIHYFLLGDDNDILRKRLVRLIVVRICPPSTQTGLELDALGLIRTS